jgi:DNA-3-methyladenine glycosylase II
VSARRVATRAMDPEAVAALRESDPVMRGVMDRVGTFAPSHEPDLWWSLVDSIASQQLSVKAAATIVGRIAALAEAGGRPTPRELAATDDAVLRACGLSRAKVTYVKDLAGKFLDGTIDPDAVARLPDEDVIEELTRVKGIGRWTAEMILIFTLLRPDVLPVDDLGLRNGVQRALELEHRPTPAEVLRVGEAWRPYRSTATLYLWRSLATA